MFCVKEHHLKWIRFLGITTHSTNKYKQHPLEYRDGHFSTKLYIENASLNWT